ncbi:MAG: hypothetical protein MUF51_11975 [Vicinamibacteria bacterium]|nr:hypothetical protein [Vicinamibacteria bacterium]
MRVTMSGKRYQFGAFELDVAGRTLSRQGELIHIAPKAIEILLALLDNAGQIVGKQELSVQISALRKTLEDERADAPSIETLPKRGYRLIGEVRVIQPGAPRSLAVLPFRALALAADEEYLGAGLADALITRLANLSALRVRPTSAVLKYRAVERDLAQIGRELNVEAVLDGSVQREGERVRLTAQLVSASDGTALWAGHFDEPHQHMLDAQDALSEQFLHALLPHLGESGYREARARPTENAAAFQEHLKGRYLWNKLTGPALLKAREAFTRATSLDAHFAEAYVGLANTIALLGIYGEIEPRLAWAAAREAAARALAERPRLSEAHVVMAYLRLFESWGWAEAEKDLGYAIKCDPRSAASHQWYALFLGMTGRYFDALREVQRARDLDPESLTVSLNLGYIFALARRPEDEIIEHKRTLELEPDFAIAHWALGIAYLRQERYAEAVDEQRQATALSGSGVLMRTVLARYLAKAGRLDEARAELAAIVALKETTYVSPYQLAGIHAALGEIDRAFELLDHACAERDHWLVWIRVDPLMADLHKDKRFGKILKTVGVDSFLPMRIHRRLTRKMKM